MELVQRETGTGLPETGGHRAEAAVTETRELHGKLATTGSQAKDRKVIFVHSGKNRNWTDCEIRSVAVEGT